MKIILAFIRDSLVSITEFCSKLSCKITVWQSSPKLWDIKKRAVGQRANGSCRKSEQVVYCLIAFLMLSGSPIDRTSIFAVTALEP
jgi:hypothetical protein